jgi:uncharacterized protein (DUF433 family)
MEAKLVERISINPKIMLGKPCIKGTRLTVEIILEKLAGGQSFDEIIEDYPFLTPDDIKAAAMFAAEAIHSDRIYFDVPTVQE